MNKLVYLDLLHQSVIKYANHECLHIKRSGRYQSWSYKEFHQDLNRLCSVLKKHGLKKGTNAVVIGENSPEWIIAYNGIPLTGACTVPVDPNIPPSEIESIVSTTEAKIVFCSKTYLNLFRMLKEKYSHLERIVLLDSASKEKEPTFDEYLKLGDEEKECFVPGFMPDDPMVIIFTSGTTGKAKGVVLTQKNFTTIALHGIPRMKANEEDTMCAVLPLHHVFGSAACIAAALCSGMDVVVVPFVKAPLILEALRDKQVSILPAVPKMISLFYESIIHNIKKKGPLVNTLFTGLKTISATAGDAMGDNFRRNLFSTVHKGFGGNLRLIISGGAALNKKYWNGFRLMGFNILEGYGLTETYGPITVCPANNTKLGSVGPALPDNQIKVANPDDSGIGEILLKGNCIFKGYYKNEELNKDVFDDEGWFHTGDLGKLDKDNFLFISGRKKDVIVLDNGKNVYPDELEDIYNTSPLIEEIGIFGINNNDGEIVAAAIVPSKEIRKEHSVAQATNIIYDELIRIGKNMPVYRRISDFITVYTPLPRTTTRKLKKVELKKMYNSIKRKSANREITEDQLSVIEMAMMETTEFTGILNSIILGMPKIDPHIINPRSHMEIDLSLDSLKRIELLSQIEKRFSITIPEDLFEKMETVGDLVSMVKELNGSNKSPSIESIIELKERILADNMQMVKFPSNNSFLKKAALVISRISTVVSNIKCNGSDKLKAHTGPLIFASNHSHIMDSIWILNSLPSKIKSNTYNLIDKEIITIPILPFSLYRHHFLNLEKSGDSIEMLKIYLSVIRNQKNLIIFPEGSISKNGIIGQFKSGIGLLARETSAMVIPVKINNSSAQSSSDKKVNSNRSIVFGKPVTWSGLINSGVLDYKSSADDFAEHVRTLIMKL